MALGKRKGRDWKVAISDADSSYTEIANIKSVDGVGPSHDPLDETDNDSEGWDENSYAQSRLNPSITFNYNKADAGQLELQAAAEGKTQVWLRFRPTADATERETRALFTITEYNISGGTADIIEGTASFNSDGTPTFANQT